MTLEVQLEYQRAHGCSWIQATAWKKCPELSIQSAPYRVTAARRTVVDTAMMQNVMCGPNQKDITSLRPKILPLNYENIKNWKIVIQWT